jgi:hypothetical protein
MQTIFARAIPTISTSSLRPARAAVRTHAREGSPDFALTIPNSRQIEAGQENSKSAAALLITPHDFRLKFFGPWKNLAGLKTPGPRAVRCGVTQHHAGWSP